MFTNNLYNAKQSKSIDFHLINELKISGLELMSKAAFACFSEIQKMLCQKITVVCGVGNNAGDGLMIAAICHIADIDVNVYLCHSAKQLSTDSQYMFAHAQSIGVNINLIETIDEGFIKVISSSDMVIDAILGTGVNRDIGGIFEKLIKTINQHSKYTLSVDIPSGVCASTGKIFNIAIIANKTVSFICKKIGLYTGIAPSYAGDIVFTPLVDSIFWNGEAPIAKLLNQCSIPDYLQQLANNKAINKSDKGHLAIIAGDKGMFGAAILAAVAALKLGAGRISVFTHPDNNCSMLNAMHPEIMCHKLSSVDDFLQRADQFDVIALGCGMSINLEWSTKIIPDILKFDKTMVIDAGALDFLNNNNLKLTDKQIITPHEGEAARLLNTDAHTIRNDRIAAAKDLSNKYSVSVLLKGCGSLLHNGKTLCLNPYGHNILATAGSGDLLTGIIGALAAQMHSLTDSASLALLLQGLAAENYAKKHGVYGFSASMLLDEVIAIMNNKHTKDKYNDCCNN